MKRILCSLVVATLPFGSVLADPPTSKNATSECRLCRFRGLGTAVLSAAAALLLSVGVRQNSERSVST